MSKITFVALVVWVLFVVVRIASASSPIKLTACREDTEGMDTVRVEGKWLGGRVNFTRILVDISGEGDLIVLQGPVTALYRDQTFIGLFVTDYSRTVTVYAIDGGEKASIDIGPDTGLCKPEFVPDMPDVMIPAYEDAPCFTVEIHNPDGGWSQVADKNGVIVLTPDEDGFVHLIISLDGDRNPDDYRLTPTDQCNK